MPKNSLAHRIDAFELELACIEALTDIVYTTPTDHPYHAKYLEDRHTHRLNMRKSYNNIRKELISAVVS